MSVRANNRTLALGHADLAVPKISICTKRRARLAIQEACLLACLPACVCVAACTQDTYVPAALRTHLHVLGFPSESACALRPYHPGAGETRNPSTRPTKVRANPPTTARTPPVSHHPVLLATCRVPSLFRASLTCGEQHRFVVYKLIGSRDEERKRTWRRDAAKEEEGAPRSREVGNGDRMRRPSRGKPTAIFPRILSPRVQSTSICLWQPLPPTGLSRPRVRCACRSLAPLLQGVTAKREHAGTVLDKSCLPTAIFDRRHRIYGRVISSRV